MSAYWIEYQPKAGGTYYFSARQTGLWRTWGGSSEPPMEFATKGGARNYIAKHGLMRFKSEKVRAIKARKARAYLKKDS